jgi:ABC-type transport system involved in cytochrome c biogenesis permease subunit
VLGYVITVAMLLALVGVILLVVAFAQDAHGTF